MTHYFKPTKKNPITEAHVGWIAVHRFERYTIELNDFGNLCGKPIDPPADLDSRFRVLYRDGLHSTILRVFDPNAKAFVPGEWYVLTDDLDAKNYGSAHYILGIRNQGKNETTYNTLSFTKGPNKMVVPNVNVMGSHNEHHFTRLDRRPDWVQPFPWELT
jgi:hypothetical protein